MTDNKLIKVLECCVNDDCSNCTSQVKQCRQHAMLNALDLIKRQKAEIEMWKAEYKRACAERDARNATYNFMRAEAIKEFAERLLALKIKPEFPWDDFFVTETAINDTLKEMTGETP